MSESIQKRMNAAPLSKADRRELTALLKSMLADMQEIATQLNTLIDDVSGATATAVTLNTTE